jgi:integrase
MGKLNPKRLDALIERPGRFADGGGLFFKTRGAGRAYWTYRFTLGGSDRERSIGPYPEITLDEARIRHKRWVADVAAGVDPVGNRRSPKTALPVRSGAPTFGQCADQFIRLNEGGWKNSKHHQQWVMTLGKYCAPIRSKPVNEIATADVLAVLQPIWNDKPETASRLRGRIEAVLAAAQVDGWIPEDRPNPARWKNWLDRKLPKPKKLGVRGHHAAMPYADLPAFMARLVEIDSVASRSLQLTILTACRTSEILGMIFDEVDFERAVLSIEAERMKMGKPHDVPLSDQAVAILKAQRAERGENPHVFPGRPMRGLSNMSMAMLMRRLGAGEFTVHGMRSAARSWMADQGVAFELAEACLAHQVGNAVVQAYQRSSMLERRRPIMSAWASFLSGETDSNVVPIKRGVG